MSDGSTPSPAPAPFAVGYGNGYGYESLPADATPLAGSAGDSPSPPVEGPDPTTSTADLGATLAVTRIDLEAVAAAPIVAVDAPPRAPYTARPAGSAHPRRRFARGLVLTSVALLATATGIGAVALATSTDITPASATASGRGFAPIDATSSTAGSRLGRGVDPQGAPVADLPPVSIIESPTITRVPPPATTPPTVSPTSAPTTTAPTTPPTTVAPTTTSTTSPPTTSFTSIVAPSTVDCPTPDADASVSFSWSAPGALQVTLSIDGPGVYRTYAGSSGTETVSFPCGQAHTYLFTAHGPGGSTTSETRTIVPS